MTAGTDALKKAFRDYRTDGVPATGANEPDKAEIRVGLDKIGGEIATVQSGLTAIPPLQSSVAGINDELGDQASRISLLEDGQAGGSVVTSTWSDLMALTGTYNGQRGEVAGTDAGTHGQATMTGYDGATVPNAGLYGWSASRNRWLWISENSLSAKANKTQTIKTRDLDTGDYRADKSVSIPGTIDVAEAKSGDLVPYAEPDLEVISPSKPTVISGEKPIIFGDDAGERFGTDPDSRHPFINGRGIVPEGFRDGTVVADSAGFLRALDVRTPKYRGEWVPELELIRADDPPSVLFDTSDPYYAVRTFQLIASIETVGNRIWAAFYGSSTATDEGPPTHIILKYSDDMGISWIEHAYISYVDGGGLPITEKRCVDPRLFLDDDGLLWLIVPVSNSPGIYDFVFGSFAFTIRNADSPTPIFSRPFHLCPYGIPAKPYRAGQQIHVPIDIWVQALALNPGKIGRHTYELDTRRRAALRIGTVGYGSEPPSYDESSAIELANGDILKTFRTAYGQTSYPGTHSQFFSKSTDGGYSWSTPAEFSQIGGNPPARAFLFRTAKGRVGFVANASVHPARTDMTVHLSEDEGETFPYSCMIDASAYVAYPEATIGPNGEILVIYDSRYMAGCPIKMAIVDEDDIVADGNSAPVTIRTVDSI